MTVMRGVWGFWLIDNLRRLVVGLEEAWQSGNNLRRLVVGLEEAWQSGREAPPPK